MLTASTEAFQATREGSNPFSRSILASLMITAAYGHGKADVWVQFPEEAPSSQLWLAEITHPFNCVRQFRAGTLNRCATHVHLGVARTSLHRCYWRHTGFLIRGVGVQIPSEAPERRGNLTWGDKCSVSRKVADARHYHYAGVAQWQRQRSERPSSGGSNPLSGTTWPE